MDVTLAQLLQTLFEQHQRIEQLQAEVQALREQLDQARKHATTQGCDQGAPGLALPARPRLQGSGHEGAAGAPGSTFQSAAQWQE